MVCGIIITIYTLLLLVASLLYVKKRYSIEKGALTRTAFKAHWVLLAITAAVLLLFVTLSIQYSLRNELLKLPVLMRWTTLLWGLYLLAYIDYRERLIPNFLICVLLIARVAFLGCNLISDPEYWRSILLYPLIGAGIGGVILAVAMLLSRKGVGMGDVKLFITIGAYVGSMEYSIKIDITKPIINIEYDNNAADSGTFFRESRRANVTVKERNFDDSLVNITLRATNDGADIALPTVSGWTSSGDRHTATIAYQRDGLYTFDIDVTDKAGNTSADFTEQTFYVDTTAPTLEITGVADRSANNGDIIPVVSYSDTNYDDAQVSITLTGAMRKGVALDGSYADQHNGKVFTFKNFAKEKEVDDIYTLAATLTDKAGNTTEKTILFSVNRFGSTYALSAATEQLNGSYVQTPQDVVVTETNPDALQNIRITLFKNNQTIILQEGTDYRIEVRGGNGQWYEYIYTVLAKNFADDGVYRLTFYSEDAAGNIAENTLDTKKQEIGFGVDKTKPNMVVTNLESDTTYPLENLTVSLSAGDNLLLQSVVVYLDDYSKAYKTWTAEEIAAIVADQGEFTFDIPGDSTGAHQVKIVCTDAAGNEQTEEITNFYVTTNLFVRYYNNKPLFFGSIAAVVVIAGVVIALAAGKKKKNDKEK